MFNLHQGHFILRIISIMLIPVGLIGTMIYSASAEAIKLDNGYIALKFSQGRITDLRFDPKGKGEFSRNILREGGKGYYWTVDGREIRGEWSIRRDRTDGEKKILELEEPRDEVRLKLELESNLLTLTLQNSKNAALAAVQIDLPFIHAGYFDRVTRQNFKPDQDASTLTFKRFVSLKTGHCTPIEAFKRRSGAFAFGRSWLQHDGSGRYLLQGLDGFDLEVSFEHPMTFAPEADSLLMVAVGGWRQMIVSTIQVLPSSPQIKLHDGKVLPWIEIESDQWLETSIGAKYDFSEAANDFFQEALNWYDDHIPNGAWGDWNTRGICYADYDQARRLRDHLLSWPVGDDGFGRDGYAYTWMDSIGWPFPNGDTRHTGTNAILITAAWRYYCWTGDGTFLSQIAGQLRRAMDYQLEYLNAREMNIIVSDQKFGDRFGGRAGKDIGTNFYDIQPFGGKDAYATILYYRSLNAMGQIERVLGNEDLSIKYLDTLMPACHKAFNETFWREDRGRYLACIDLDGNEIDFGHTFLHLEAMEAGLVPPDRAERIFAWLDDPDADTYTRWRFAARHNTIHNESWWPPFIKPGSYPWDTQVQNGGALLSESAFDLISRARFQGADGLYRRIEGILKRYAEPDKLTGGNPLFFGEMQQGAEYGGGAVGIMANEFPETAIVSEALFSSVLGITVDVDGMNIAPVLPTHYKSFKIHNLCYWGNRITIGAAGDQITIECTRLRPDLVLQVDGKRYHETFKVTMPRKDPHIRLEPVRR